MTLLDPARFVVPTALPERRRLLRLPLGLADRPLVAAGQRVELGQPVIEHFRDQEAIEIATSAQLDPAATRGHPRQRAGAPHRAGSVESRPRRPIVPASASTAGTASHASSRAATASPSTRLRQVSSKPSRRVASICVPTGLAVGCASRVGPPFVGAHHHRRRTGPTRRSRRRASMSLLPVPSSWSARASTSRPCRARGPSASPRSSPVGSPAATCGR